MDSEIENYFKEMIAMFENDGGASFESDDILFVDESECSHNDLAQCQRYFMNENTNSKVGLQLVVNTGKSDLGVYQ